ncbi:hypothetical protein RSAG8_08994, partial [Rhizoctonia solani AG-8 WAC10335]
MNINTSPPPADSKHNSLIPQQLIRHYYISTRTCRCLSTAPKHSRTLEAFAERSQLQIIIEFAPIASRSPSRVYYGVPMYAL